MTEERARVILETLARKHKLFRPYMDTLTLTNRNSARVAHDWCTVNAATFQKWFVEAGCWPLMWGYESAHNCLYVEFREYPKHE